jgi:hypothetical protein
MAGMLREFLSQLPEELALVKSLLTGAPVTSATICVVIIGAVWLILHFVFKNQLATKNATIAHLKGLVDYPATEPSVTNSVQRPSFASTPAHNYLDSSRTFFLFRPAEGAGAAQWIARIHFARSGGPAHLRLDFSYFPEGVGHIDWTVPRKMLMRVLPAFVSGQDISVPVTELRADGFWYWATENGGVILPSLHHCRLLLLEGDNEVGDFSFLIMAHKPEHPSLTFIGENHFSFAEEWRSRSNQTRSKRE